VLLARENDCAAFGLDASASALSSGQRRAHAANISPSLQQHDLAHTLPFDDASFDAVISTDVVLHLPNRRSLFGEVRRVLRPGGRFLFTDAGVVTGVVSSDEIARRSAMSTNYLAPVGHNEECLTIVGLELCEKEDRTGNVAKVARGRLAAYAAHRAELLELLGDEAVTRDENYLSTVAELAERRALSRFMYCAERISE
jgi:SAM-dependent methyltransferase